MFKRLCLIGTGLIGGSLARAVRSLGLAHEIVAFGRDSDVANLQTALKLGVIDAYFSQISQALEHADLVIVATPVGAMASVFAAIRPYWQAETVYSDVGSTKGSVIAALESVFGEVPANFVPAHPIAGAERSGVEASNRELFQNRRVIVTPLQNTDAAALHAISELWRRVGASVSTMSVQHHDTVLAATSHLPHILAFALVGLLGKKDEQREIFKYAAGGFKDFSRIASSDPTMWLDICLANKQEIIPLIQNLKGELDRIEQMIEAGQEQELYAAFSYANRARQRFLDTFDE
ncbi:MULTISPECIES: prephenate dehydrogenase [Methylomonas]|uniref:prephenate dehydrogenase n=1 Tax=Methylomonas TaxID=416 RepID=UPI0018D8C8EF|nr:prephenate dehydrogenase/arogenate dehydrogenase family protein [Methylomonas rhizoryzae]